MTGLFSPGSAPWLLVHELRLGWRGFAMGRLRGMVPKVILGFALVVGIGFTGILLGYVASQFELAVVPESAIVVDAVLVVLATLMTSQAMALSVQALYDRQDLDLLFSSPLSPRIVLTVRALGISVLVTGLYVSFVTPFILTASVLGRPAWLGLFVLLGSLGLLSTAVGLLVTSLLFVVLGPRRTRTVAQITAGLMGGAAFLGSRIGNLTASNHSMVRWIARATASGIFDPGSVLAWPVRSLAGDVLALAAVAASGGLAFVLVLGAVGPRFATLSAQAVATGGPRASRPVDRPFAGGLQRVLFTKELRLLARDPQLLSQVVLRLVYLAPLAVLLFQRSAHESTLPFACGALVIVAGQLSGSFAWITLSAEDAPDLLASAPIGAAIADRAKLAAALVPTFAILGVALAGMSWRAPAAAIVVLVGCSCAALSSGLVNVWQQVRGSRKAFNQRRYQSFLTGVAEFLIQVTWATATGTAVAGWWWGLLLVPVAVTLTLSLYRPPSRRHAS